MYYKILYIILSMLLRAMSQVQTETHGVCYTKTDRSTSSTDII